MEYAALGRRSGVRWWRRVLSVLVVAVVFVVAVGLLAGLVTTLAGAAGVDTVDDPDSPQFLDDPVWDLALGLVVVTVLLPCCAIGVRLVERRRAAGVWSVAGRLRWGLVRGCLLPAVVATLTGLAVVAAVSVATGDGAYGVDVSGADPLPLPRLLLALALVVLVVPFQAAAEEYARGYVIQAVGHTIPGVVAATALFVAGHVPLTWPGSVSLAAWSLAFGYLMVRLDGIEAAVTLHVVWNAVGLALQAPYLEALSGLTAGQAGWALVAGDVGLLPMYVWLVLRARSRTVEPVKVPV